MRRKKKKIIPAKYNGSNDYYPINLGRISYPDDSGDYWKDFRNDVIKVREKSQDDFEKYLNIFGSGGLLIGLTLLSKLIESKIHYDFQWMLILGSILFLICLLSNLLSHYLAVYNNDKNINDIDTQCKELWQNFDKRNRSLGFLNWTSLGSIIIGTILITLFLMINLNTMPKQQNPQGKPKTTQEKPKPVGQEKGRTTSNPTLRIEPKK